MTARLSPARRHAMIALLGVISVTGYTATHAPSEAELSHAAVANVVDIERQELNGSERLGMPTKIAAVGDHVVVIDAASDAALHVINRMDGEWIRSFGGRGEGPGEFTGAWSLDPVAGARASFGCSTPACAGLATWTSATRSSKRDAWERGAST